MRARATGNISHAPLPRLQRQRRSERRRHPPFCSERCRVIDLGRWLDEAYAVPEIRRGDDEGDGEGAIPPELLRQDEDDHEA